MGEGGRSRGLAAQLRVAMLDLKKRDQEAFEIVMALARRLADLVDN